MNIKGLDKAEVLVCLYNAAKVQGMGFFVHREVSFTVEEARKLLAEQQRFDYLNGKVLKIDLTSNEVDTWLYNRDNGNNAAENAISHLKVEEKSELSI